MWNRRECCSSSSCSGFPSTELGDHGHGPQQGWPCRTIPRPGWAGVPRAGSRALGPAAGPGWACCGGGRVRSAVVAGSHSPAAEVQQGPEARPAGEAAQHHNARTESKISTPLLVFCHCQSSFESKFPHEFLRKGKWQPSHLWKGWDHLGVIQISFPYRCE